MVNAKAIEYGLMIGMALGCELADRSIFHRKNYFYPDNPKAYQISQYDEPLCGPGRLGDVRIHRVHLEEDAAKLVHAGSSGRIHGSESSVVDFNRCGTPLVEIVTEPDVRSAEQAREWLTLLRETLRQLGVSDVDMSQGSLRCDANVSIRPKGEERFGTKTELKNMNSFAFLEQGMRAEIQRQIEIKHAGGEVVQETLHFDPRTGRDHVAALQGGGARLPLLPRARPRPDRDRRRTCSTRRAPRSPSCRPQRAERYEREFALSADNAQLLAFRPEMAAFFEAGARRVGQPAGARGAHPQRARPRAAARAASPSPSSSGSSARRRSRRRTAASCSTASPRTAAATPSRSSRPRAWARWRAATSSTRSSTPRWRPTPTPPRRSAAAT